MRGALAVFAIVFLACPAVADDRILVQGGDYPAFVIDDRAVAVIAATGAAVRVESARLVGCS